MNAVVDRATRALAAGLIAVLGAQESRAQSGPPASVAFHSNRDGNNNIYVMDPGGSNQTRLTEDSANDQRAEISPDGSRIVFASTRSGNHLEIFVMGSDGSDVRPVTLTAPGVTNTWPRWSPDGEWIAFQSNVGGVFQIFTVRPDGTGLTQITTAGVNQFPSWSPDGTRLAVRRDNDIYVIDLTGQSDPQRLTFVGPLNQMASWSPDGTKIAFMSTRAEGNYPSVFVMNADGSDQTNLTPKMDSGIGTWTSRAPAWSPNGSHIYFTGIRPGAAAEQIYFMRADGSDQPQPLTGLGVNAEATVRRVRPPVISSITATPDVLWPPDNRLVQVSVEVVVSDDSDPAPVCDISNVASNESVAGIGWQMTGALTVELPAQRRGKGAGRIYTLTVTCTNSSELSSTASVGVSVPHDRGR
jgi:Tol biopolymer transport system component